MTNEVLLTAAKLREMAAGDLQGDPSLLDHAGLPVAERHVRRLTFLHGTDTGFAESELSRLVRSDLATRAASNAVDEPAPEALSYLVGVTEQELDASSLTLPARMLKRLATEQLTSVTGAGNPNSGKTNTMLLLLELARLEFDDLMVITNVSTLTRADVVCQSMYDLVLTAVQNRDVPKFVFVDEGSTHFDAHARSHEVTSQWSPSVKRFSKVGVEVCGVLGHTGKDIHPEQKRLTNLAFWKSAPDRAEFFAEWPEDASFPADRLFGGELKNLEPVPPESYDPDDASPWSWDLPPGVFNQQFSSWAEFADLLADEGRASA